MSGIRQSIPVIIALMLIATVTYVAFANSEEDQFQIPKGLPEYTIDGETDLDGNFFISFVYTRNIMMLDGKGNIVWAKHEEQKDPNVQTGFWDFKKHVVDGKVYYSYHDQDPKNEKFGLPGFAPGERVILDSKFREVKRISFEKSDTVEKGHPLDGHDFLLIDLDHYIMSGYLKERVYNVPGYETTGSNVIYSYLQEVKDGQVVWDWKSIDYPELYSLTVTDATPTANDFANVQVDAPDYVHFNAMRLNDDGDLVCSFRHLDTILCLDRTKDTDQIKWRLSGNADEFGLAAEQKTSGQHYVTVDGNVISAFDNHNITEETRIVSYTVDMSAKTLLDFKEYRIDGKFSEACGAQQRLYDDTFMIGWGAAQNDKVCMCVYDFAADKQLISMTLKGPSENFTYRCVYYE